MQVMTETNPLRELLEETGMSHRELGALVGVTRQFISMRANGKRPLSSEDRILYGLLLKIHRDGGSVAAAIQEIQKSS